MAKINLVCVSEAYEALGAALASEKGFYDIESEVHAAIDLLQESLGRPERPSSKTHWYSQNGWLRFEDMDDLHVFNTYHYLARTGQMSAGISREFFDRNLPDRAQELRNPNQLYQIR